MRHMIAAALLTVSVTSCATGGSAPINVGDTPSNRIYFDQYAGAGYRVKIARDQGKMGSLCMTQIFIDGQLAAEIGQAEAVVFKLPPGTHQLKIAPALKNSTCQTFYSDPKFHIEQSISGSPGDFKDLRYGFSRSGLPFLTAPSM